MNLISKSLKILMLLIMFSNCSSEDKPYQEFDDKLKKELCECISLGKPNIDESEFLEKYGECVAKTTKLLKEGLDAYEEDPRMSKEEYQSKLPYKIQQLARSKCK